MRAREKNEIRSHHYWQRFRQALPPVYATRAGLNVLMTDAHMPPHQHGSHHGDTRLIRHAYGEGEKYVPLVLRAQTLWDELPRHNEDDPIFVRSGVINLGPADSAFLANVAQRRTVATQRRKARRARDYGPLARNTRPGQLHRLI
ncbi:FAD-dependent oxidoreductase [Escherichia coli]